MAIYRIYPSGDSSIYSEAPLANNGLDEILELGAYRDPNGYKQLVRILVNYDLEEVNSVSSLYNNGKHISASINLYVADAYELPLNFDIDVYPLAETWDTGRGKFGDVPLDVSGVSWVNRLYNKSGSWDTTSSLAGVTSSFENVVRGGGTWYSTLSGSSIRSHTSFTTKSELDLSIDISKIVDLQRSGSLPNNGLIIKLNDSIEKIDPAPNVRVKYFSLDTNTIYPPYIELKWDDFSYQTGSLSVLNTSVCDIKIQNNKGTYSTNEKTRFRVFCRPKYPQRIFTTSSVYTLNYALPINTYWAIRDEHSKDTVVNFDTIHGKISCDSKGPYFTMYMNTLQPERYYRLLLKTEIDGSDILIDSRDNIFKVTRNV